MAKVELRRGEKDRGQALSQMFQPKDDESEGTMRRQKNTFAVQVNGETVHECTLADAAWRVARMYEARGERVRILMNGELYYEFEKECRHPAHRIFAWMAYDGELCATCCHCGAVLKGASA
jgi:hypothetical protein